MDSLGQNNSRGRDMAAPEDHTCPDRHCHGPADRFLPAADRDLPALPALTVLQVFLPLLGEFSIPFITYLLKQ
jgi:hypothetical protein